MLLFALLPPAIAATSSLSWVRLDGAETCVAAPELAADVESRLGRSVFRPPAEADVAVEGHVERVVGGDVRWRAVLRLTDHAGGVLGDRVVESRTESCAELGQVVAVTLALMIDPVSVPEPLPPPPPRWHVDAHAALTGGYGMVPGVTAGGSATVILTPPGFVPLLATGDLVPYGVDTLATYSRATGGLQICPLGLERERWLLRGCLGADAGAIFALEPKEALVASEWVLVQGRVSLRPSYRLWGPILLDTALHLVVPFRAVEFVAVDGGDVYRPAPFAVLVDLGVGARF